MFSENKDALRKYEKCSDYFQNVVKVEENIDKDLRLQDLMASNENPRVKFQVATSDICKELRDIKTKDILEQKRRQRLLANNEGLRLIQSHIQSALAAKQLEEQNEILKQEQAEKLQRKRDDDAKFIADCEESNNAVLRQQEIDRQKKLEFSDFLKKQMDEMQEKKKKKCQDAMKDREEMQKTLKRIQAEEQAEKDNALRYREYCKRDMEECVRNREIHKKLQREENIGEAERLWAYQKECDEKKKKYDMQRKHQQDLRMALSEQLGKKVVAMRQETEKREELLLSLLVEERAEREAANYRRELDSQVQHRNKLRMEMETYYQELLMQKARVFQEEERKMQDEHMRLLAERDKLDQLSNEKRRQKIMAHNRDLKDIIEKRRQERAQEVANRITEFQKAMEVEKETEQCIENERIRMLQATPKELLRFLPPGVIKPSDKAHLSMA